LVAQWLVHHVRVLDARTVKSEQHADECMHDQPTHPMDPDQDYANVRVYTRHLQPPSAIHQTCIVDWTRRQKDVAEDPQEPSVDIVFGKVSPIFLSSGRKKRVKRVAFGTIARRNQDNSDDW